MRALLLTVGSQGDVQPFVALARRLRADGHDAVLAAPEMFGGLAAAHGVPFAPLDLDMSQIGAALAGRHGLRHAVTFWRSMGRRAAGLLPGATAAARLGADIVVHHPVLPLGQHLAELLGVPAVVAPPMPALVPTAEFLSPAWPGQAPAIVNRPSYRAARQLTGAWCRRDIDRWRRDVLALPPRPGRHDPLLSPDGSPVTVLHSFSAQVIPRPADWPATAHITGYWTLPAAAGWSPPRRLAEFVEGQGGEGGQGSEGGEQPVVSIGFGSMPDPDPGRLAEAIIAATRQAGVRAVVASMSPALRRLLPAGRFLVIRQAPHDWLFPRVRAIVHHGGAGTAGAAVLAGRPQIIWPFGVDQHFWARRMTGLGVAPPALPVRELTGRTLAAALDRALGDSRIGLQAAELGFRVRTEDGPGQAVARLQEVIAGSKQTPVGPGQAVRA